MSELDDVLKEKMAEAQRHMSDDIVNSEEFKDFMAGTEDLLKNSNFTGLDSVISDKPVTFITDEMLIKRGAATRKRRLE